MDGRKSPEQILKEMKIGEKETSRKGKLKIFFGYAAGVGKTYSMLDAAKNEIRHGVDVTAGYIEPHARPETMALLEGMEVLSPQVLDYRGIRLKEFDLDAALYRKSQLILVDELAHTNAEGCRHTKRYQDVRELLEAGIDVYTTVNVQHLESLYDIVASITHVTVQERIPDAMFDEADEVELVDIEPKQLLERLKDGKIYKEAQAKRAAAHFFTEENLTALREIALRRTADRVNRRVMQERSVRPGADYYTKEHIAVCISPSPTNAKVIRTAARMANAFQADLTAVFVETSSFEQAQERTKQAVYDNMKLAKQFGARPVVLFGDDIAYQIAEYAKTSGVSKVVLGRTSMVRKRIWLFEKSLIERLTEQAPNLDVYVIPDAKAMGMKRNRRRLPCVWTDGLFFLAVFVCCLLSGWAVFRLWLAERGGFLFALLLYSGLSLLLSGMTLKLKTQSRQEAQKSRRMQILLNTSWKLRRAIGVAAILEEGASQIVSLLGGTIAVYNTAGGSLGMPKLLFPKERREEDRQKDRETLLSQDETAVAAWVMLSGHRAGRTTDTLPGAKAYYYPVKGEKTVAVYGIMFSQKEGISPFEKNILKAIVNETAFAAEKYVVLSQSKES